MDKIRSRYTQPDFQFARFRIAKTDFGLALKSVKEILRYRAPEKSNDVPSFIEGFLRLRGMAVPVVDLRKRFCEQAALTDLSRIIIAVLDRHIAGLIVDEVNDIALGSKEIKQKEFSADTPWSACVEAVIELGPFNIYILNPSLILTDDEKRFLDAPFSGAGKVP